MHIILFILVISDLQCTRAAKEITPVFLMDYNRVMDHLSIEPNPFFKMSTAHFADIVHEAKRKCETIILFIEDEFSVEDTSIKDKIGTPYQHLESSLLDNRVKYLPRVVEPYKLFMQVFQPNQLNTYTFGSSSRIPKFDDPLKFFYVFFRDGKNETRAELLRRHDSVMREVYFGSRKLRNGPVLAFYTGKMNPVQIDKIELIPMAPLTSSRYPGVVVVTDGAIFRFVGVFSTTHSRRAHFNQIPMVAEETWTSDTLSTKMAYTDFELEFNFSFKDKEWILRSVSLLEGGEEVGKKEMGAGAKWNYAYYCSDPLKVVNTRDGSSVTISEYKIQPLRARRNYNGIQRSGQKTVEAGDGNEGGEGGGGGEGGEGGEEGGADKQKQFGETVHCGPFFTPGILMALMVTSVLLFILSFGLSVLFNCKANDRFDDPHGKPLVLGAVR